CASGPYLDLSGSSTGHRRRLGSFPTRRSSDLETGAQDDAAARPVLSRAQVIRTAIWLVDAEGAGALSMRRLGAEIGVEAMALYRSEEHTSELQSRFDVVCRLLLEKKKSLRRTI